MKALSLGLLWYGRGACFVVREKLSTSHKVLKLRSKSVQSITPRAKAPSPSGRLFSEELNIIYDSKCNVCKFEIDFLKRRDERLNRDSRKLKFTDLEDPAYDDQDPANGRVDYETGMKAMHAILPDGKILVGVPVFAVAYKQVRLGWLFRFVNLPIFGALMDWAYDLFAKYRTLVTRGSSVQTLVDVYKKKRTMRQECQTCNKDGE